jgi:hypothetical protein
MVISAFANQIAFGSVLLGIFGIHTTCTSSVLWGRDHAATATAAMFLESPTWAKQIFCYFMLGEVCFNAAEAVTFVWVLRVFSIQIIISCRKSTDGV